MTNQIFYGQLPKRFMDQTFHFTIQGQTKSPDMEEEQTSFQSRFQYLAKMLDSILPSLFMMQKIQSKNIITNLKPFFRTSKRFILKLCLFKFMDSILEEIGHKSILITLKVQKQFKKVSIILQIMSSLLLILR